MRDCEGLDLCNNTYCDRCFGERENYLREELVREDEE